MNIRKYITSNEEKYLSSLGITDNLKRAQIISITKREYSPEEFGKKVFEEHLESFDYDRSETIGASLAFKPEFGIDKYIDYVGIGQQYSQELRDIEWKKPSKESHYNNYVIDFNQVKVEKPFLLGVHKDEFVFVKKKDILSTIKKLVDGKPPVLNLSLETWFSLEDWKLIVPFVEESYKKGANIKKLNKQLLKVILPIYNKVKFT